LTTPPSTGVRNLSRFHCDSVLLAMLTEELNNRFTYHKPIGNQPQRYELLRAKAKELATLVNSVCPESREKAHGFTQLEDAVMWFNAAIARNENETNSNVQIPDSRQLLMESK
jgi:hypothetical protein